MRREDHDLLAIASPIRRDAQRRPDDREEIVITRAGRDPVVMVALDDYESLKETAYLVRSPENARRLPGSIQRLEAGRGEQHDVVE